ncbi:pirin family protein [Asticcacaulis solisilvae]|uniref:pirin family protein n=1 Tax=Asticcacaulis solisilvae TaxID=1217274 RepID=UPI003FD7651F
MSDIVLPESVTLTIPAREKDLGGFHVRRVLPFARHRMVGPWIFFDHMGPASFDPGHGVDVRPHPHINLATVTYLFEGHILHRDSLGSDCVISPGDINLMVAGRGIVHSERENPETFQQPRRLDGLQLWLALPEADEETDPAFFHYEASAIPEYDDGQATVRVMMGEAFGLTSPVRTYARTLYIEARLKAGAQLQVPMGVEERAIYVCDGELDIDGLAVEKGTMAVLAPGAFVQIHATTRAHFVVIGGEHLGERHIYWNFVSSRPERIEQAKADWRDGRFPKVPGDDQEFIPLPE